jgi:hypothetical protein
LDQHAHDIKARKNHLAANRTSGHAAKASQFRLFLRLGMTRRIDHKRQ